MFWIRNVVRLKMPPDQHRSTLCDDVACRGGEWNDVQWSADGQQLAFVSTSRDHKEEKLRIADAGDRRGARRAGRDGADVFRIRQRASELAVSAGIEGVHLVFRARQLGPALSLRPDHRAS